MRDSPVAVVMVSALTQAGADATIRALELGAADVVAKPSGSISLDFDAVAPELVRKVKRVARTVRVERLTATAAPATVGRAATAALRGVGVQPRRDRVDLCVIGASTGGPRALTQVIPLLPAGLAVPVVVVQHMPEHFTASLAKRLDELSALQVSEAGEATALRPGQVLVARGGRHLEFRSGQQVQLTDTAPVHGVRPSIDVCLQSVPATLRPRTLVAILTGMGSDGADGASAIWRGRTYRSNVAGHVSRTRSADRCAGRCEPDCAKCGGARNAPPVDGGGPRGEHRRPSSVSSARTARGNARRHCDAVIAGAAEGCRDHARSPARRGCAAG
jgi:two-component system chemotaxis response regulator CheB